MFKFLDSLFPPRYESRSMLDYYIRAQYGPYLAEDATDLFEGFYEHLLGNARGFIHPDTRALDIGCGTGRMPFEYARLGALQSCGTETSEMFLDFCERIKRNEVEEIGYPIPETLPAFLKDDICASTLPTASFDLVSCLNVIDRVSDPAAAVASIERITAPRGVLLIATPYDWTLSPASRSARVSNIKDLLSEDSWTIENEEKLLYRIPTGTTAYRDYDSHLVIARRKAPHTAVE